MEKEKQPRSVGHMDVLLGHSADAILATNAEGIIQFANKEACELTGLTLNELIGVSIVDVYENIEAAREANRKIYQAGGTIHDMATRTKTKSGQVIPVRVSASHLYDSGGKYIGGVGYFARYQPSGAADDQMKARIEQLESRLENWKNLAVNFGKISKEAISSWIKSYPALKKR
ncbi:MAG: PAS domain-containing protein [Dehalococcoidales bacterium]|jgi:PAS domain S-box-containing protein